MKRVLKIGAAFILLVLLFGTLLVLPEYVAAKEDEQYINKYVLYEKEVPDESEYELSLEERLKLVSGHMSGNEGKNQVLSIYLPEDLQKSDSKLLKNLQANVKRLEELELIPKISSDINWQEAFSYGELYNLSLLKNPYVVTSLWHLEFYNYDTVVYRCSIILDADTYKIYQVSVSGETVWEYEETAERQIEKQGSHKTWWDWQWMHKYGEYLKEDSPVELQVTVDKGDGNYIGFIKLDETAIGITSTIYSAGMYDTEWYDDKGETFIFQLTTASGMATSENYSY